MKHFVWVRFGWGWRARQKRKCQDKSLSFPPEGQGIQGRRAPIIKHHAPHPTPPPKHATERLEPRKGLGVGWSRAHGPRVSDRCDSPKEPTSAAAGRQGPHKPSLGTSSCREMGEPLTPPRSSDGGLSGSGSQGDSQAHLSRISSSSPCLLPRGLVLPGSGRQKTPRAGVG